MSRSFSTQTVFVIIFCVLAAGIFSGCCGNPWKTGKCVDPSEKSAHMKMPLKESGEDATYMPREVIVKLKPGVNPAQMDTIATELGLEMVQPLVLPDTYLMRIIGHESVEEMVNRLNTYDAVDYSEPNFTVNIE